MQSTPLVIMGSCALHIPAQAEYKEFNDWLKKKVEVSSTDFFV
jgi:hypothetical protein